MHRLFLQHQLKKIRNSILSSDGKKKTIIRNGTEILWQHWLDAFNWNKSLRGVKVNHRLREEHFQLDGPAKMRNKLAVEVLNKDMLHLMKESLS